MCEIAEEEDTALAQINVGILNFDPNTRLLTPDTRKGVLKVVVDSEETFKLIWRPRDEDAPRCINKDDFFTLVLKPPSKVEVTKIKNQLALSVRVDNIKKAFFWIQETSEESEYTELINEINEAITTAFEMCPSDVIIEEPPKQQVAPQPAQPQATTTAHGSMSIDEMTQLIQMMTSNMPKPKKDLKLDRVLIPEKVIDVLLDPKNEDVLKGLYQFMPESTRSPEGVRELIRSSQFYRDVKILEAMIKSGEAGPILADFKMDLSAQGPYGGMRRFLEELIRVSKKK